MHFTDQDIDDICQGNHRDVAQVLGLHKTPDSDYLYIAAFNPLATRIELIDDKSQKSIAVLQAVTSNGLFYNTLRREMFFNYQMLNHVN